MSAANPAASARYLGAFLDELMRWGVREVVVSPGSRSTPLSMCAYELSCREPECLRLFVDVDERGAAFFALGLAKASGRPVALICTSGSAVANYYPAVLEAEASRVPLIVLTGDRPPRLQGLGAPQTCDQLKAFGDHVRSFCQMPLPGDDEQSIAFARQAAREAVIAAGGEPATAGTAGTADTPGTAPTTVTSNAANTSSDAASACNNAPTGATTDAPNANASAITTGTARVNSVRLAGACFGGPVHLNFPFEEPLKPDFSVDDLFETGRRSVSNTENVSRETLPLIRPQATLSDAEAARIAQHMSGRRTLVLAGEGTCADADEARAIIAWAQAYDLPLLADPLSGLRSFDDELVIDNYDTVFAATDDVPAKATPDTTDESGINDAASNITPEVIIRFGRWPISKRATTAMATAHPLQIVVDPLQTRDFNAMTDLYIAAKPVSFAGSLQKVADQALSEVASSASAPTSNIQQAFAQTWMHANDAARERIVKAGTTESGFEGAFVQRMVELAPEGSCIFSASSMSIRALDTFYLRSDKHLSVLCNRGLNGIDGTVSSALGAAQNFDQTTLLIGDLALLHDLNALALQRELRVSRETSSENVPSIVIVLLNNNGGGIFDMLPQRSDEPYFERLFLTPQDVDFKAAAEAFGVPYRAANSVSAFEAVYQESLGVPGISLIEITVPLRGLPERYTDCWS